MSKIGTYILFSKTLDKFYIGVTQDDVESRIDKHNTHYYGKRCFTAKANDWKLKLFISTANFAHAVRVERKIKSMKSSKYIQNLINNESSVLNLIEQTKAPVN